MCTSCSYAPFGNFWPEPEDEEDLHEALRNYAREHLGAPKVEEPVRAPKIDAENFGPTFRAVLERSGWPVLKCGHKKGLKRCLMLDGNDNFTWGSKKGGGAPTSVPLADLKQVSRVAFNDGPPGASKKCMLVFNVNDTHGLKILAESHADALVLAHGFNLLIAHSTTSCLPSPCSSPSEIQHSFFSSPKNNNNEKDDDDNNNNNNVKKKKQQDTHNIKRSNDSSNLKQYFDNLASYATSP